jgi:hypothetical protein
MHSIMKGSEQIFPGVIRSQNQTQISSPGLCFANKNRSCQANNFPLIQGANLIRYAEITLKKFQAFELLSLSHLGSFKSFDR